MRLILRTAVRSTTAFGSRLRCCAPCAGGLARKARWIREEIASLRRQALRYRLGPDCGEVVAKTSSFASRQFVAEGAGFEPAIRFPAYTLSRRAPSAARPPLRRALPQGTRARAIAPPATRAQAALTRIGHCQANPNKRT